MLLHLKRCLLSCVTVAFALLAVAMPTKAQNNASGNLTMTLSFAVARA